MKPQPKIASEIPTSVRVREAGYRPGENLGRFIIWKVEVIERKEVLLKSNRKGKAKMIKPLGWSGIIARGLKRANMRSR